RVALAAATAERGGPGAAAPAAQLQREGEGKPCPAHPDRMAEGDGAAVDVDAIRGDAEVAHRGEGDSGERLVDLDEVQVVEAGGAIAAECVPDGVSRLEQQRR